MFLGSEVVSRDEVLLDAAFESLFDSLVFSSEGNAGDAGSFFSSSDVALPLALAAVFFSLMA